MSVMYTQLQLVQAKVEKTNLFQYWGQQRNLISIITMYGQYAIEQLNSVIALITENQKFLVVTLKIKNRMEM